MESGGGWGESEFGVKFAYVCVSVSVGLLCSRVVTIYYVSKIVDMGWGGGMVLRMKEQSSSPSGSGLEGVRLVEDAVPKTVAGKTVGGSNPSPSAKSCKEREHSNVR